MSRPLNLVQVHLGTSAPAYLYSQLRQARIFNPGISTYLILGEETACEQETLDDLGVVVARLGGIRACRNHRAFRRWNRLGRRGLDGFWLFAAERFFAIESFLSALDLENVIHLENDVMLYANLERLWPALDASCPGIGVTMDCEHRCIPGFVFIRDRSSLSTMNDFMIRNSLRRGHTDMEGLASFMAKAERGACSSLPVVPPRYKELFPLMNAQGERATSPWYDASFDLFGGIFDAAAIGQYLGGIDTRGEDRDTKGFVNETSVYDPRNLDLHWKTESGLKRPFGTVGGLEFPIFNLHIHSKRLEEFSSDAPNNETGR